MKHIKTFENNNKEPEKNDYAIVNVKVRYSNYKPMNVIGQITDILPGYVTGYIVKYTLPDGKTSNEVFYHIKHWSKNKEELENIINQNKYNL